MNRPPKLEKLLADWRKCFKDETGNRFVSDGALDDYWGADPRICAVLKEPNQLPQRGESDHASDYADLRRHHMAKLEDGVSAGDSIFKLSVWASAIRRLCDSYQECKRVELVKQVGPQLAVVNVKKTPGGPQADSSEIMVFASRYREELSKQIELLDPDIVFACGSGVDDILMWLFHLEWNRVRGDDSDLDSLRWAQQDDRIWVALAHPSYPPGPKEEFHRLREQWPEIEDVAGP